MRAPEAEAGLADLGIEPVSIGGARSLRTAAGPAAAARYAARARRRAPRVGLRGLRVGTVPVGRPLPHVAGHVEDAERARTLGVAPDRRGGRPAIVVVVERPARGSVAARRGQAFRPARV